MARAEAASSRAQMRRRRRSHAERTAETRARCVSAVVESIAELGYSRTTASEIARRAGVTWGAVQHHFGGKEGILAAALEDSFRHFLVRVGGLAGEGHPLERRVALFVERAWAHFASPHYRSTFEILTALLHDDRAARPDWQRELLRAWDRVWHECFGDSGISRRRLAMLERYAFATLSGLAATRMLGWREARLPRTELDLLSETLVRELELARPQS